MGVFVIVLLSMPIGIQPCLAASGGNEATVPLAKSDCPAGYQGGIGVDIVSAGRFGFAKGDGLLDWDYPDVGYLEKAYFAKHPLNKTQSNWAISFYPASATDIVNGDPNLNARRRTSKEDIKVSWVNVDWTSQFAVKDVNYARGL